MRNENESDVAAENMAQAIKNYVDKTKTMITKPTSHLAYLTRLEVIASHIRFAYSKVVLNWEDSSHLDDSVLELEMELVELLGDALAKVNEIKAKAE